MNANWIVVASADHVRRGRAAGFSQACHGKAAPMRRIRPGDRVVCYSPRAEFGGSELLQAFTAIGIVREGEPYRAEMEGGFKPYRRDMAWLPAEEAPIRPLLDRLEFTTGDRNWGYKLRLGLFPISEHDLEVIAGAMRANLPA
jgi:hypothetical protein